MKSFSLSTSCWIQMFVAPGKRMQGVSTEQGKKVSAKDTVLIDKSNI